MTVPYFRALILTSYFPDIPYSGVLYAGLRTVHHLLLSAVMTIALLKQKAS